MAHWYSVLYYDPLRSLCDLRSENSSVSGNLYEIPVLIPFGGSEETAQDTFPEWFAPLGWGQFSTETEEGIYNTPRWGVSYPIQPGDFALVEWLGSPAEPFVTAFSRLTADIAPAIVALGFDNFYAESTPTSVESDRYDLLLPTGAWLTSHQDGSWTIATPPVHNARNFFSQFADGRVRLWARSESEDDYLLRLDFDPTSGQITVETIPENSSTIKFTLDARSGNVTLNHSGNLNVETGGNTNLTAGGDMQLTASNIYLN